MASCPTEATVGSVYPEPDPHVAWLKASEVEAFLGQTKVWRNKANEDIPILELDAPYALNIMWFLEKKAEELWALADNYRAYVESEMDDGPIMGMPFEKDKVAWMRRTELYRAIAQQAYRARAH